MSGIIAGAAAGLVVGFIFNLFDFICFTLTPKPKAGTTDWWDDD